MYEIKNIKGHRKFSTKYIILSQVKNLFPVGQPLDPSITRHNRRYTWGTWQKFFNVDTTMFRNPCHYFIEYLDNDYTVYSGLGFNEKSYFLDDLIDNDIIERKYKDSIFILIQEDMEIDKIEDRLYVHLASKVICPLMVEYGIPRQNIVYIDDILKDNWEDKQLGTDLDYGITTANFFNEIQLTQAINRYKKIM